MWVVFTIASTVIETDLDLVSHDGTECAEHIKIIIIYMQ